MNLHVSFQLLNDTSYHPQLSKLKATLDSLFGEGNHSLDYEEVDVKQAEREVIYNLISAEGTTEAEFFVKLQDLFEQNARFLPSFTQSSESPRD